MLALAWRFRAGCLQILAQQTVLVTLGLSGLGLTGLGIDVIRRAVDRDAAAPRWPWGIQPPADWSPMAVVALIAGLIALLAIAQASLRFHDAVTASRLAQRIVVRLRSDIYDKLGQLSFGFLQANPSSAIINRVAGDVQSMRMFVDGVIIEVLAVGVSFGVYLAYMLRIHVGLTLASLATTPLLWFLAVMFSRLVKPAYRHNRELSDQTILRLSETVQGVAVVKGLSLEQDEIARFALANSAVRNHKRTIFWKISLFQPTMYFFTKWNVAVLLAYGGYLVIRGELLLGEGLFVFANLLQQIANQIEQVTNIANTIQSSIVGAQRVFEVIDAPIEVQTPPQPERAGRVGGAIRFEGVSFAYQPGSAVLDGLDFTIRPGQRVAILGATGAGKTSLLGLIPRYYDTIQGRVLIDGVDVRRWQLDDLRRGVGMVFQESFLFSHTVAANIAFGRPDATRAEIERAAHIAAANEFILELPHGYDTIVGEYGANLSGGQRQRLALARAVLTDPAILMLDDATASVDSQTEHEILEALAEVMRDRTTLIVTHRRSVIERADAALVLDRGRLVHFGSPAEALELVDGSFALLDKPAVPHDANSELNRPKRARSARVHHGLGLRAGESRREAV
jgi:ATP-binding cassette, subfamily B, bacterial